MKAGWLPEASSWPTSRVQRALDALRGVRTNISPHQAAFPGVSCGWGPSGRGCLGDRDVLDTVVLPQGAAAPHQAPATSDGLQPTRVCESTDNCPAMELAGSPVLY